MAAIFLSSCTLTTALGCGLDATAEALQSDVGGLQPNDFEPGLDTWIGRVSGIEDLALPAEFRAFDCRNNRLALLGLGQDGFEAALAKVRTRYGPHRIGLFIGTSSSGIGATERAYRQRGGDGALPDGFSYRHTHDMYSVVDFVRRYLGLHGPGYAISTACSSSAKVFAAAQRYLAAGLCDAAVVGGVDSLCLTTLYGFNSLGLVSDRPCRPWDAARNGLSIGEGAGFAVLETSPTQPPCAVLLGVGESSDAYHMSTPHPRGTGARLALRRALDDAGVDPREVDYVNLHGTATAANDSAEDQVVVDTLGRTVACSSTKGSTGHTLGAAGMVEALISVLAIRHGFLPGCVNTATPDPDLHANLVLRSRPARVEKVVSNAFGFGGSNCSLVLGRVH